MTKQFSLDWAYALGQPLGSADFRSQPEDFQVTENLGFELSGVGEHVFLLFFHHHNFLIQIRALFVLRWVI